MNKADKKRSEYYNYYSYKTWGAAATYHLCIDSSVLGIEKTIDFIEDFVKLKIKWNRTISNPDHTFPVSSPYQLHTKSKCIDTEQVRRKYGFGNMKGKNRTKKRETTIA